MTLSAQLLQREHTASDERALKRVLAHAWCWPRQPGLQTLARALAPPPAAIEPGETLLLTANGQAGGLWRLIAGDAAVDSAELGTDCRQQLQRLQQQVSRDLPFVCQVDGFFRWSVAPIHVHQQQLLSGPSFGLAFALATASRMLGLALPPDSVACAVLSDQGRLEPVELEGLRAKLRALRDWAPGVARIVVAEAQAPHARTLCTELDVPLHVEPVRDLEHAIAHCFGDIVQRLEQRWQDTSECARLLQRLFLQLVEGGTPLLRFEGVARGATLLARAFPEGSDEQLQAQWISIVARGHDGAEDALPLRIQWLDGLRRPLRLRVLAHEVGRAVYAAEKERRAILGYALAQLPASSRDDHPDDLRVLGALGRHTAMLGDYAAARSWLTRAVQGWHELAEWKSGTYALCELIRIAGVTRDRPALEQLLTGSGRAALSSSTLDHTSLCFLSLAAGRAWAQLEDWIQAAAWLGADSAQCPGLDWTQTPAHLGASRSRWAWLAAAHLHDSVGASDLEAALGALETTASAQFALCLHRIDKLMFTSNTTAHTVSSEALQRELAVFRSSEPKASAWVRQLAPAEDILAQASALTRHYPY